MKTFDIQIKTREQVDNEFIQSFKAAQSGKKITVKKGVFFSSLEAVRGLLTEKRLNLLHAIREHHPQSIYQLAKITGRDFKNIHTDVMMLKQYGLIQLGRRKQARNTAGSPMTVPYEQIHIHAVV